MNIVLIIVLLLILISLYFLLIYDNRIHLSDFSRSGKNSPLSYYVFDSNSDKDFKNIATSIIQNSGWNEKYNLKPVDSPEQAYISVYQVPTETLAKYTNKTDNNYDSDGRRMNFSIASQSRWHKPVILIDADNWKFGVKRSGLTLDQYREYVVTHEFGHALGFDHIKCTEKTIGKNGRCPVMNQSTRGCKDFLCGYQVNENDFINKINGSYFR